ncbi:MAG: hypothetical protein ACFB10_05005 [Salibacteraceae bacterium]
MIALLHSRFTLHFKTLLPLLVALLLQEPAWGQGNRKPNKWNLNEHHALSLGARRWGVAFGNPAQYTGIRFGIKDKNANINGLSFTLYSWGDNYQKAVVNGLNFGLFYTSASLVRGISFSPVFNSTNEVTGFSFGTLVNDNRVLNGIGIGGLAMLSIENRGLSMASLGILSDRISGVAITGLFLTAPEKLRGVGISGFKLESDDIKGFMVAPLITSFDHQQHPIHQLKGVSLGLYTRADFIKGIHLSLRTKASENQRGLVMSLVNHSESTNGIQICLVNKTDHLNGMQVGLINIVKRKYTQQKRYRWMPFFNFSFQKGQGGNPSEKTRQKKLRKDGRARKKQRKKKSKGGK